MAFARGARGRGVLMISMASASNTRANRRAADFVSRSYVSRTPLTATFPTRVSDYIRAVAETTDEEAAQLAVEAAGAPSAWAERLGGAPGWPGTGRRLPERGRGAGPLGPLDPGQRFIRDRTKRSSRDCRLCPRHRAEEPRPRS
jgi:lysophospholipase L1-like esterase